MNMDRFVIGTVFVVGATLGALVYREYAKWAHSKVLKRIFEKIEQQQTLRLAAQQGEELGLYRMNSAARSTVN